MKRIITLVLTFVLTWAMCADVAANRRYNGGGSDNRKERIATHRNQGSGYSRPGYGSKPGNGAVRPGNGNNGSHKPGNGAVRPGNGNNGSHKPGNGAVRPGNGNNGSHKPGNGTVRPGNGNNGSHKPGNGFGHPGGGNWGNGHRPYPGHGSHPAVRPGNYRPGVGRPPMHAGFRPGGAWHRPVPPRGWRPGGRRVPAFRSILGINFGLSIGLSLQALQASNYIVDGYNGNEVYLTNVPMQGYYWPSATMYYNNGGLVGSQFVYPSTGYDMARYNGVYNSLYNAYGAPVVTNGAQVTWFGGNNEFITLNFMPVVSGGVSRFYTTLSFGI